QIAAVDRRVWLGIAKRYVDAIHWQLESNDVASQIAALESVGEAGDLAAVLGRRFDFVRRFVPDVLRVLKQPNPAGIEAAARAAWSIRGGRCAWFASKPFGRPRRQRTRWPARHVRPSSRPMSLIIAVRLPRSAPPWDRWCWFCKPKRWPLAGCSMTRMVRCGR